jgi:hypothetical protein
MNLLLSCLLTLALTAQTALAGPISAPLVSTLIGSGGGGATLPTGYITLGNATNVFSILAGNFASALTSGNVYPFYKNGALYQVTSGKTAYCFNGVAVNGSTGGANMQLVTDTVTFAFNATTASLTSPVYYAGAAGRTNITTTVSTYVPGSIPGIFTFPSLKWPGFQANNAQGQTLQFDCIEQ